MTGMDTDSLAKVVLDCQRDGSPTYNIFSYFTLNRTPLSLNIAFHY